MTPERWRQIEELFHDALLVAPADRARFLAHQSGDDEALRREVESLLASSAGSSAGDSGALQALAGNAAAGWAGDRPAGTVIGRAIGHYRIVAWLGAGGMGEVYLADDPVLGRRIALKLLRASLAADPARIRRFEQEARTASALNHPSILTIHEIGSDAGLPFMATEFVDGDTLRQRVAGAPMPLAELLDISIQVAGALEAAHGAGVVHRDIKPENIMVRRDGFAKVLDFGLAKLAEALPDGAPPTDAWSTGVTHVSRAMGTVAYMSPEQALGQAVDHRTDIFSLGVVLYEMATGSRPLTGESEAALSNPCLHADLERVIARALETNRDVRYQSMADVRADLVRLRGALGGEARPPTAARRAVTVRPSWRLPHLAPVLLIIAAGLLIAFATRRFTAPGSPTFTRVTDDPDQETFTSLSPDARLVAYSAMRDGNWDVYVRPTNGGDAVNLTSDSSADDDQPVFSPDGTRLAFHSTRGGGGLFVMEAGGGSVRRLTDAGFNPSWLADGTSLVYSTEGVAGPTSRVTGLSQLWTVDLASGRTRQIETNDAVQPAASPHGRRIAYWGAQGGRRDIWTVSLAGGDPVPITRDAFVDWNPVWAPDGESIYFISDRGGSMNLWRVAIDEATGRTRAAPQALTTPSAYIRYLTVSSDGRHIAYVETDTRTSLQRVAFDAAGARIAGTPLRVFERSTRAVDPAISPDGNWLAFTSEGDRQEDLFVIGTDGRGLRQLTDDPHKDRLPAWSPDGSRLAFFSNRGGQNDIWVIPAGGGALEQLTHSARGVNTPIWSPDGRQIAFNDAPGTAVVGVPADAPRPAARRLPAMADPAAAFVAVDWSRDGRRILGYSSAGKDAAGIVEYSFDTAQYRRVTTFGNTPVWLADGERFLFNEGGRIYFFDPRTKTPRELFALDGGAVWKFDLSRDNRWIHFGAARTRSDVWILGMP